MINLVARRLLLSLVTVVIVSLLTFSLVRVIPGGPAEALLGEAYTKEQEAVLNRQLGLDRPFAVQYVRWMGGLLRGDFGTSLLPNREKIGPQIATRLEPTLLLMGSAILLAVLFGIPIGVIAALRQGTALDLVLRSLSIAGLAVPGFYIATQLLGVLAKQWNWNPPIGWVAVSEDPIEALRRIWMPALILSLATAAQTMRMSRAMMLEVLRQDYIRTAWAKGLSARRTIVVHAVRNALLPVVTVVGLSVAALIGGTVIFETLFGLPGMGTYMINSVVARDYTAVQGAALIYGLAVILVNLLVDLSYLVLDPRLRNG
jgi:peptide/nickel transport system permease protein